MTYEAAYWHYNGDFPNDLPNLNGGTHIGMFLAWCIINGLQSEELDQDCVRSIAEVRLRLMTGCQFLFKECDEKLLDDDLNDIGNAFAAAYFSISTGQYLHDYSKVFLEAETLYHVEDTWVNYERIANIINERFNNWVAASGR